MLQELQIEFVSPITSACFLKRIFSLFFFPISFGEDLPWLNMYSFLNTHILFLGWSLFPLFLLDLNICIPLIIFNYILVFNHFLYLIFIVDIIFKQMSFGSTRSITFVVSTLKSFFLPYLRNSLFHFT